MEKTAIITGATGMVGSEVIRQLLNDNYYDKVIAVVRRPLEEKHEKLIEKIIDFEELPDNLDGISADHGYCCLGTTIRTAGSKQRQYRIDHDYVVMSAEAFRKTGVTRFAVISSIGADKESSNFYLRTKGEMEHDLMNIPFENLLILRPSFLIGKRKEYRFGESIAGVFLFFLNPFLTGRLKKYRGIKASAVAEGMISAMKNQSERRAIIESDRI